MKHTNLKFQRKNMKASGKRLYKELFLYIHKRIILSSLDGIIKVGRKHHDMRIACRIVGVRSTKQSVGIIVG